MHDSHSPKLPIVTIPNLLARIAHDQEALGRNAVRVAEALEREDQRQREEAEEALRREAMGEPGVVRSGAEAIRLPIAQVKNEIAEECPAKAVDSDSPVVSEARSVD